VSAPFELRPYQEVDRETIRDAFRRFGRVVYQLPTGGGKTVIFVHIIAAAVARGRRICILVHLVELIEQISQTLAAQGIAHGIVAPGHSRIEAQVQIASVQTLRGMSRLGSPLMRRGQGAILDEALDGIEQKCGNYDRDD